MKHIILTSIACTIAVLAFSQSNINIEIDHRLNGNDFNYNQLGTNNLNEDFEINRLEYYMSQFSLSYDGGQTLEIEDLYILADAGDETSFQLGQFDISHLESLTFFIGVDPDNNHSDPAAWPFEHPLAPRSPSMHWGWAAGYRFLAMEGVEMASDQIFELHCVNDENYFSITIPIDMDLDSQDATINILAHYEKILNDIEVAQAPIIHGGLGVAKLALENMRDYVFEFQGISTDIPEAFQNASIELFPNPSFSGNTSIIIRGVESINQADVEVFDIVGKSVLKQSGINLEKATILQLENSGVYVVRISSRGRTIATKKLIVQ